MAEQKFDPTFANKWLESIEEKLDAMMVFNAQHEDDTKPFTYEEYVELRALLDNTNEEIKSYYRYLEDTKVDPKHSYIAELLYGYPSRIDTIEKTEGILEDMEEVLGLNNKEGEPKKNE